MEGDVGQGKACFEVPVRTWGSEVDENFFVGDGEFFEDDLRMCLAGCEEIRVG